MEDLKALQDKVKELELRAKIKKLGGSTEKVIKKEVHHQKSEETKMNEELKRLESQRDAINRRGQEAAKGKSLLGRAWVGFKSHNQQYAIQSQIGEIKGISNAKRQSILYAERARALEQRNKLRDIQKKSNISMDNLLGTSGPKGYKPITFEGIGMK